MTVEALAALLQVLCWWHDMVPCWVMSYGSFVMTVEALAALLQVLCWWHDMVPCWVMSYGRLLGKNLAVEC